MSAETEEGNMWNVSEQDLVRTDISQWRGKNFEINQPGGNPALITEDKQTLNELSVRIHYVLSILLYSQNFITELEKEASQLIETLKKEYHLE